jgi:hypothetical protein
MYVIKNERAFVLFRAELRRMMPRHPARSSLALLRSLSGEKIFFSFF